MTFNLTKNKNNLASLLSGPAIPSMDAISTGTSSISKHDKPNDQTLAKSEHSTRVENKFKNEFSALYLDETHLKQKDSVINVPAPNQQHRKTTQVNKKPTAKKDQDYSTFELTMDPKLLALQSEMPHKDYPDYQSFVEDVELSHPTLAGRARGLFLIYSKIPYNATIECFSDGINVSKRKFYHSIAVDGKTKNFFKSTPDELENEYCFANPPWTDSYIKQTFLHFEQLKVNTTVTYVLPDWDVSYYTPPLELQNNITVSKVYPNTSSFYGFNQSEIQSKHIMFTVYYHFTCSLEDLRWNPYTVSRPKKINVPVSKGVARNPEKMNQFVPVEVDSKEEEVHVAPKKNNAEMLDKAVDLDQANSYMDNLKFPLPIFNNINCKQDSDLPCVNKIKSTVSKVILLNLSHEQLSHITTNDDGTCDVIQNQIESIDVTLNLMAIVNGVKQRKQVTVKIEETTISNSVNRLSSSKATYDKYFLSTNDNPDDLLPLSSHILLNGPSSSVSTYKKFSTTTDTVPPSHYYDLPTCNDVFLSTKNDHSGDSFNNLDFKHHYLDPSLIMNSIFSDISKTVSFSPYQALSKNLNLVSPYIHNYGVSKMTSLDSMLLPLCFHPLDVSGNPIDLSLLTAEPLPSQCKCDIEDNWYKSVALTPNNGFYEIKELEAPKVVSKYSNTYSVNTFLPAIFSLTDAKFKVSSKNPVKVLSVTNAIGRQVDVMYYLKALQLDDVHRAFFYHSIHNNVTSCTLPSLRPLLCDNKFLGSIFLLQTYTKDGATLTHDMAVQLSLYSRDKYLIVEMPNFVSNVEHQITKQTRVFTFTDEPTCDSLSKNSTFCIWLLDYVKTIKAWELPHVPPMFNLEVYGFKANLSTNLGSNLIDLSLPGLQDKDREEFRGYLHNCMSYSSKILNSQFKMYDENYKLFASPYQLRGKYDRIFEDANSFHRFSTSTNYGQYSTNFVPNYVSKVYSNYTDRQMNSNSFSQRNTFNNYVTHPSNSLGQSTLHLCEFCSHVYPSMFGSILCKASHLAVTRFKMTDKPNLTFDINLMRGINPNEEHTHICVSDIPNYLSRSKYDDLIPAKLYPNQRDMNASKNYVLFSLTVIDTSDPDPTKTQVHYSKLKSRPMIPKNRNFSALIPTKPLILPNSRQSRSFSSSKPTDRNRSSSRFNANGERGPRSSSVSRVYYNSSYNQ